MMIEDIGNRIQSLRLAKGLSLSELASRAGVAKSYLSNVERNAVKAVDELIMNKINKLSDEFVGLLFSLNSMSDEEVAAARSKAA